METTTVKDHAKTLKDERYIKCVVWDLDHTLWDGVLLEDQHVHLKENVTEIIKALDERGILQSVASKNDYELAMAKLAEFGLQDYFLYPQISWNSKVSAIENIARSINIGMDTIAFVDDQQYELAEVNFSLPKVMCIDAAHTNEILTRPEMNPRFITEDSRLRRIMYLTDLERKRAEEVFVGPKEEFLATLNMVFVLSNAKEDDLQRAEELTLRTNQLNATGYTYSYDELNYFRQSSDHKLIIASLDDKYGSYGKIGLSLIECKETVWTIKLLLMSCRVMSRGVGTILINHIRNLAKQHNVRLCAEFIPNDRNRMMYVTYKFAGFKQIDKVGDIEILEDDFTFIQSNSDYVKVMIVD
jgi:FkbH-like protein